MLHLSSCPAHSTSSRSQHHKPFHPPPPPCLHSFIPSFSLPNSFFFSLSLFCTFTFPLPFASSFSRAPSHVSSLILHRFLPVSLACVLSGRKFQQVLCYINPSSSPLFDSFPFSALFFFSFFFLLVGSLTRLFLTCVSHFLKLTSSPSPHQYFLFRLVSSFSTSSSQLPFLLELCIRPFLTR